MDSIRLSSFFLVICVLGVIVPRSRAVNFDTEITTSGGSTSNLFSDSTGQSDTYVNSSADLKWHPLSFAQVNLVGEYRYYGNFFMLSNLTYGGGLTIIPAPDSSRLAVYFEGNVKKRKYRDSGSDSTSLNANEITGDEYDGMVGVGYSMTSSLELRTGIDLKSTQYTVDGIIDRERADFLAGINSTWHSPLVIDLELGYSTGKYQYINPMKIIPGIPEFGIPDTAVSRGAISPGEQYSILLIERLKSFYISPRVSRSLGRKSGLSLTYSHRQFLDRRDDAVVYGYSTGYLSPWLGEYAGQAVVLKFKTYLVPKLITTVSCGFWEREYLRTVERMIMTDGFGRTVQVINLLFARDRTDWRRRFDFRVQWPLVSGHGTTIEPSLQIDYTDNNSTVPVYTYDDFSLSGGITVRF